MFLLEVTLICFTQFNQFKGECETDNEGIEDHCYGALEDNKIKDAACAIFESLDLLHKKGSLKDFEELLTMAKHMYCKGADLEEDDEQVRKKWPSDWYAAKHPYY